MNSENILEKYVLFLRGINVGGHHKLPMKELSKALEELGLKNIITILNSGNVIFETITMDREKLEKNISEKLDKTFSFPVPVILIKATILNQIFNDNPFQDIVLTKDIRLYVSFLKKNTPIDIELPWSNVDHSFKIIGKIDRTICSVLDLSVSKTIKSMQILEKLYGKNITTRNWKTIERIIKKC